ncbi:GntP family permease [Stomatohabitans albus]|uniref:GntP family permease n=1 Tax=Stomatohabitans albus TaxID=3110766 RepID=UPI00300C9D81
MDIQLLLALVLGIATIVVLVLRTRLDAFVALLIASVLTGLIAGFSPGETISSMTTGFGNTLGSVGIVIGLGVGIGKILELSGAADIIAQAFLKLFGKGREEWAMGSTGAVVSIPVFCDSGYIILNPLARSLARRRTYGYVAVSLAMGCGMTLTHHMVPPTPGPLAVAGIVGADMGAVIAAGLVFTVLLLPVVVTYAKWIGPKLENQISHETHDAVFGADDDAASVDPTREMGIGPNGEGPKQFGVGMAFIPLILPLALIVANTVATAIDKSSQGALTPDAEYTASTWAAALAFIGHPVVALIIGLVLAVYWLLPRWVPATRVQGWLADAAASAGLILLITGAGGGLGQVLRDSGVGDELAQTIAAMPLPAYMVPFLIATLVRLAQGSGTVAMITAASVSAPLVASLGISPLLVALGCSAGSMCCSYYNDSYFWVVTRFTGLEGTAALKGWSGITTTAWAASFVLLTIASFIL